jgi:DNA repair exonuclease SbcCD ATPase subunit
MAHDINSALERLEKNLSELDSARSQVMQSVNASNDLLKMVTQYVSAVKKLAASLEEWESSLSGRESELHGELGSAIACIKQTCTDVISAFKGDVNKVTLAFKKDTDKTLEEFTEQNDKLAERVAELVALREQIKKTTEEIESVKGSLELISKDLKESQDEQDIALEEIKTKVSVLPTIIQQSLESITQAVSRSEQTLAETLNQINGKTDTLAINIANLTTLCQSVNSTITSSANNLTNVINNAKDDTLRTIKESQDEITKVSNIDRWIMIIGFIIVIIMFFVIK